MSQTLRVLSLYPELMNIYADRGNIAVLRARCEWRGIGFEHEGVTVGDSLDPDSADLFYMGGGQDRDQAAVAVDMASTKRDALHAAADRGAVVLGVCGGYQLLGESYQMGDETLPGVGLVDLKTVREAGARLIGNCAIEADLGTGPRSIAGFENHGGRTYLGDGRRAARPRAERARQQRQGRLRGRAARQRDRHLPARAAPAEERVAGRPADRAGDSASSSTRCPATRWRTPRTRARGAPRAYRRSPLGTTCVWRGCRCGSGSRSRSTSS